MKMKLNYGAFVCILLMSWCRSAPIKSDSLSNSVDNQYPYNADRFVETDDGNAISLDDEPFTSGSALDYNPSTVSRMYRKLTKIQDAKKRVYTKNLAEQIADIFRKMIGLIMNPKRSEYEVINILQQFNAEHNFVRPVDAEHKSGNAVNSSAQIVQDFFDEVRRIINSSDPSEFDTSILHEPFMNIGEPDDQVETTDSQKDAIRPLADVSDSQDVAKQLDVSAPQDGSDPKELAYVLKEANNLLVDISDTVIKLTNLTDQTVKETYHEGLNQLTNKVVGSPSKLQGSSGVDRDVPSSLSGKLDVPTTFLTKQLPTASTDDLDALNFFSKQLTMPGYNFMEELPNVPFAIHETERLNDIEASLRRVPLVQNNVQFLNMTPRYHSALSIKKRNLVKRVKNYLAQFKADNAKLTDIAKGLVKFVRGSGDSEFLFSIISECDNKGHMKALFVHYKKQAAGTYVLQKLEFEGELALPATLITTRLINPANSRWADIISYLPREDSTDSVKEFLRGAVPDLARVLNGFLRWSTWK